MTLRALFDEKRRTEIRHAIERGEPVPFRRREPQVQMIMGENNGSMHSGGYMFMFEGMRPDGCAIIDITKGDESVAGGACPMDKESRLTLPDGRKVTIMPSRIATGNICTISIDDKR